MFVFFHAGYCFIDGNLRPPPDSSSSFLELSECRSLDPCQRCQCRCEAGGRMVKECESVRT